MPKKMSNNAVVRSLLLGLLAFGGVAQGQGTAQPKAATPVTQAVAPASPASQASADDIAFAKRLSNAFKSAAKRAEPSVVNITQLNRVLNAGVSLTPDRCR